MTSTMLSGLRARLHTPGPLFMAQSMFPDPGVAAILGGCKFDFVMLDAEHGPFTLEALRGCIDALKATSTSVIVRTASHSDTEIKQVLDLGADGVMVPHVETAEDLARVVAAARFAPEGSRGISRAVRAAQFGLDESYTKNANSRTAVIAIIESRKGLENAEAVARVPGLDAIMVGSDDLAADLGVSDRSSDPGLLEAVDAIVKVSMAAGIKVGARMPRTSQEQSSMLIYCGNDAIVLRTAFEEALARQRAAL